VNKNQPTASKTRSASGSFVPQTHQGRIKGEGWGGCSPAGDLKCSSDFRIFERSYAK